MQQDQQPDDGQRRLGQGNLRPDIPTIDISLGRRPDPELNTSTRPESPSVNYRKPDQLDRRLVSEKKQGETPSWIDVPIGKLRVQDIIDAARKEANKIITETGSRYKTEAQQLAESKGRQDELASKFGFVPLMWAYNGAVATGIVASGASLVMTFLFAAKGIDGFVGSPALAFSAVTSGAIAAATAIVARWPRQWLGSWFDDKIPKCLSMATATPLVCDKMEWAATLIGNIDRMNPVFPVLGRRNSTAITEIIGDKYKLSYWKDIARKAIAYAYERRPSTEVKLDVLKSAAKDLQFDQKLDPPQHGKRTPGMSEFVDNLRARWFRTADWLQEKAFTVAAISGVSTAICIPTIVEHSSKFGRYVEFLYDISRPLWGS